jgi:predicted O-methyltransferase YrrM
MDEFLISTLADLERFGLENDENTPVKEEKMLNITHDTGEFLSLLIKATNSKDILEIGTSNGYSTIWLADAVRETQGKVWTIESDQCKIVLAEQNFIRAGVADRIRMIKGNTEAFLQDQKNVLFDFIFLDADRSQYTFWWPELQEILRPGGLMVVDNAISHLEELVNFTSLVKVNPNFETTLVPVGKGELLIWKRR